MKLLFRFLHNHTPPDPAKIIATSVFIIAAQIKRCNKNRRHDFPAAPELALANAEKTAHAMNDAAAAADASFILGRGRRKPLWDKNWQLLR
ncbi:MAG: hypothetical protein J5482_04625 [Oscillospiraceae bacterium]|nr:hypothetical protein [Oscillospiraceae bacterium]